MLFSLIQRYIFNVPATVVHRFNQLFSCFNILMNKNVTMPIISSELKSKFPKNCYPVTLRRIHDERPWIRWLNTLISVLFSTAKAWWWAIYLIQVIPVAGQLLSRTEIRHPSFKPSSKFERSQFWAFFQFEKWNDDLCIHQHWTISTTTILKALVYLDISDSHMSDGSYSSLHH